MSAVVTIRQTTTTTTTKTMNTNNNNNNNNDNSQTTVRSFGITQPISIKGPDQSDLIATKNLEDTLRSYDYFESSEELTHRGDVMAKINVLVREWIRNVSLAKNVPPEIADSVGGYVHTFGSYRLGVHSKGIKNNFKKIINPSECPTLIDTPDKLERKKIPCNNYRDCCIDKLNKISFGITFDHL